MEKCNLKEIYELLKKFKEKKHATGLSLCCDSIEDKKDYTYFFPSKYFLMYEFLKPKFVLSVEEYDYLLPTNIDNILGKYRNTPSEDLIIRGILLNYFSYLELFLKVFISQIYFLENEDIGEIKTEEKLREFSSFLFEKIPKQKGTLKTYYKDFVKKIENNKKSFKKILYDKKFTQYKKVMKKLIFFRNRLAHSIFSKELIYNYEEKLKNEVEEINISSINSQENYAEFRTDAIFVWDFLVKAYLEINNFLCVYFKKKLQNLIADRTIKRNKK